MLVPLRWDNKKDKFIPVKKPKEGLLYPFGFLEGEDLSPIKSEKFFRYSKKELGRYNKFAQKEKITKEVFPLWFTEDRTLGMIDGRKKMIGLRFKTFQDYEFSVHDRLLTQGFQKHRKEDVRIQKISKPKKKRGKKTNTIILDPNEHSTISEALKVEFEKVNIPFRKSLIIRANVTFKDSLEDLNFNISFVSRSPIEFFDFFSSELVNGLGSQGYTFTTHEVLEQFYDETENHDYIYKIYRDENLKPKKRHNLLESHEIGSFLIDLNIEPFEEPNYTIPRQENFDFDSKKLLKLRRQERENKKSKRSRKK